jgi:hypothetical protein
MHPKLIQNQTKNPLFKSFDCLRRKEKQKSRRTLSSIEREKKKERSLTNMIVVKRKKQGRGKSGWV